MTLTPKKAKNQNRPVHYVRGGFFIGEYLLIFNMPKKSVFKELLKRRIPKILGSYFIAGTSLVLSLDWFTVRYDFPQY